MWLLILLAKIVSYLILAVGLFFVVTGVTARGGQSDGTYGCGAISAVFGAILVLVWWGLFKVLP